MTVCSWEKQPTLYKKEFVCELRKSSPQMRKKIFTCVISLVTHKFFTQCSNHLLPQFLISSMFESRLSDRFCFTISVEISLEIGFHIQLLYCRCYCHCSIQWIMLPQTSASDQKKTSRWSFPLVKWSLHVITQGTTTCTDLIKGSNHLWSIYYILETLLNTLYLSSISDIYNEHSINECSWERRKK